MFLKATTTKNIQPHIHVHESLENYFTYFVNLKHTCQKKYF